MEMNNVNLLIKNQNLVIVEGICTAGVFFFGRFVEWVSGGPNFMTKVISGYVLGQVQDIILKPLMGYVASLPNFWELSRALLCAFFMESVFLSVLVFFLLTWHDVKTGEQVIINFLASLAFPLIILWEKPLIIVPTFILHIVLFSFFIWLGL